MITESFRKVFHRTENYVVHRIITTDAKRKAKHGVNIDKYRYSQQSRNSIRDTTVLTIICHGARSAKNTR
jgi:hypothetical protein